MASGTLGQADLAATTNTTLYTVTAGKTATVNISLCNRNNTAVTVRLAVASTSTPGNSEYINYNAVIPACTTLERTGIVVSAGKNIVAYASIAGVSVSVYGFED